jgi:hypothetical protein
MTSDEVKEVNERRDSHSNGNPHLYSETLYIGAVYKGDGYDSGDHPFVLVETAQASQEYLLISLRDGMPAGVGGANQRGYMATASEREIRKYLSRNNMDLVAADAKTYYAGGTPENIEEYVKNK